MIYGGQKHAYESEDGELKEGKMSENSRRTIRV